MADKEIDAVPSEPRQAVVYVKRCPGCLGMPHGSVSERINCLTLAVTRLRAENTKLKGAKP